MTNKLRRQKKLSSVFRFVFLSLIFFLTRSSPVFPGEDIKGLMAQGEAAVARGDYEQAAAVGARIGREDPRDLNGYRFLLIYCASTGREVAFYKIIEEAKNQGVPKLAIDELAAKILYVSDRMESARPKLLEYENEWYEEYGRSK